MSNIRSKTARAKLKARREPHWQPLKAGRALGYRKMPSGTESWVARLRSGETGKQSYRALGKLTDTFCYDEALAAAEGWFAERDAGVVIDGPFTVADACREYVAELRREKRTKAAEDAEWRFKRGAIYGHEDDGSDLHKLRLGRIEVRKLRPVTVKQWRQLLDLSDASVNRMTTALRAALNLAVDNDKASKAVVSRIWRKVKQYRKADGRRKLTLDKKQRQAILNECSGAIRNLVEAAIHTGCRPGELRALKRSDFDGRTGTLRVEESKTDSRSVPLSPAATAFFKRMSKGKLPTAPLLSRDDGSAWIDRWSYAQGLRAAATRAKLPPGVVLYTFRHSWITDALLGGMPTLEVAKLTGTSLQMIEDNYGHLVQGAVRERLAKLDML